MGHFETHVIPPDFLKAYRNHNYFSLVNVAELN
jgi:hypothetical protein